jgi:hypothetical protein
MSKGTIEGQLNVFQVFFQIDVWLDVGILDISLHG